MMWYPSIMKYKIGIKSKHTGKTDWITHAFSDDPVPYDSIQEAEHQIELFHKTAAGGIPSKPTNFDYVIEPIEEKKET